MLGLGAIPQIHVSPYSFGTILVLIAVILLVTHRDIKSHAIGFLISYLTIITHPVSPLIIVLFLLAPYIVKFFIHNARFTFFASGIFSIIALWFARTFFICTRKGGEIAESLYKIVTLKFAAELEYVMTRATTSTYYLYPEIKILNKIVDYSIIIIALICICHLIISLDLRRGFKELRHQMRLEIRFYELFFLATAFLCFLSSLLFMLSGVGTGWFYTRSYYYFIFAIAAHIGSSVQGKSTRSAYWKKYATYSLIIWFTFLALIYPLIAHQNDSYTSYPPSEGIGMQFTSSRIQLNGKTINMYLTKQLLSYISPETQFIRYWSPSKFPISFTISRPFPDIVIFRRTMYFQIALNYDLSLTNNFYTRELSRINNLNNFNKIYSSPTFTVFNARIDS